MRSPCKKGWIFYCVFHHYFLSIHPCLNLRSLVIAFLCISVIAISSQLLFASRAQADASISLDPDTGPTGTVIAISGSGFEAGKLTDVWFDSNGNGAKDTGETSALVVTTSEGELPPNLTLTAPEEEPGDYQILVDVNLDVSVEASATFTHTGISASLALDPYTGPSGMEITITGTDFDPDASGWVWFDSVGNGARDTGEPQISVNSTAEGTLPAGVTLTVPDLSLGDYYVRADIPEGDSVEASALFDLTQTTLWLTVTKKDAYGNVLDTITVDYIYMMNHMPLQGDGGTHYYHQGPTFEGDMWDPGETENLKDKGAVMGTALKDLGELVGGMSPGNEIMLKAVDGWHTEFAYENIYEPLERQGVITLCWYNGEDALSGERYGEGYPQGNAYHTAMQIVFLAGTTNPEGKYVFGNADMRVCLPDEKYQHFYEGLPSTNGLSGKWIEEIAIFGGEAPVKSGEKLTAGPADEDTGGFPLIPVILGIAGLIIIVGCGILLGRKKGN